MGAVKHGGSFKGRQFIAEVILWAVRWYLMFPISYRDLELMLADRGVEVDHTSIFRWIQAYATAVPVASGWDGLGIPAYRATIRDEGHREHAEWAGRSIR
jgi:hypothetical protein